MDDIRARPTNPSHKPGTDRSRSHVSDVADSGYFDASDDQIFGYLCEFATEHARDEGPEELVGRTYRIVLPIHRRSVDA